MIRAEVSADIVVDRATLCLPYSDGGAAGLMGWAGPLYGSGVWDRVGCSGCSVLGLDTVGEEELSLLALAVTSPDGLNGQKSWESLPLPAT